MSAPILIYAFAATTFITYSPGAFGDQTLVTTYNMASTATCNTTQSGSNCVLGGVDIAFVLDGSGSISSAEYTTAKNFLFNLTGSLTVGTSNQESSVGMVLFGSSATVHFSLDQHTTNAAAEAAVQAAPKPGGGTCIACGMNEATNNVFTPPGDRTSVPNVMIVLTDGQDSTDVSDARLAAQAKGIHVYAVGVGTGVNMQQLEAVAGDPGRVYTVATFGNLLCILTPILEKVCHDTNDDSTCPEPPSNGCWARLSGDPHYRTFDGRTFDWQGTCNVMFSTVCPQYLNEVPYFSISHTSTQRGSVSILKTALISMYGNLLELGSRFYPGFVLNGVAQSMAVGDQLHIPPRYHPNGVTVITITRLAGNHYKLKTAMGMMIRVLDTMVKVWDVPGKYQGKLCGMAGDCNGNTGNDWRKPDGTIATSAAEFGNSWIIDNSSCSAATVAPEFCQGTARSLAEQQCAILLDSNGPFDSCQTTVDINTLYEDCVFDYCASNDFCASIGPAVAVCKGTLPDVGWPTADGKFFSCLNGNVTNGMLSLPSGTFVAVDAPDNSKQTGFSPCASGEKSCWGGCGPGEYRCCSGKGKQCPRTDQKCCDRVCTPDTHKCCGDHLCDPGFKCCNGQCIDGARNCCSNIPCDYGQECGPGGAWGPCV